MGGYNLNFEAANDEAEGIVAEASAVAEERIKEKFPDLPSAMSDPETADLT